MHADIKLGKTARAENEACEAVVLEFKAFLVQNGIAPPIVRLCDELAARIKMRRLFDREAPGAPDER